MIFILLVFLLAFGVALIGLAAALVVFWVLTHGVLRLFGYELTAARVAKVSVVLTVVAAVSFLMSEGMFGQVDGDRGGHRRVSRLAVDTGRPGRLSYSGRDQEEE